MIDVVHESPPNPTEPYVAAFKTFAPLVADKNPPWINQLRKSAITRFAEIGFPTVQQEDWKYTNVAPLVNFPSKPAPPQLAPISAGDIERFTFNNMRGSRLVFLNGQFAKGVSKIFEDNEVVMASLLSAMENYPREIEKHLGNYAQYDESAFTSLNTAFFQDGAFISLPDDTQLEAPIHLLFVSPQRNMENDAPAR